jgi:hypothetical protein
MTLSPTHQALTMMKMLDPGLQFCMMQKNKYFPVDNLNHSGFSSPDASSSVVFEGESSDEDTSIDIQKESKSGMNNDAVRLPREIQFLYIQMEFCEKSTLRYIHTDQCLIFVA